MEKRMADPAPIHEHAISNLRYIREAMERASAFTSIPGWGGVAVGVSAAATAVVAQGLVGKREWLLLWLAEAIVAAIIAAVTMTRKARRANVSFTGAPARRFFMSYFAPIVAGAALTFVLARVELFHALPATWLLLYGVSFVASGAFSIRVVPVMGVCFMVLGIISCFVPFAAGNVLLGAGFGGLHVIFGFIIARSYGG
jgi:hypothetical protein